MLRARPIVVLAALLVPPLPGRCAPATTVSVDGETVTILRDAYGVPHVYAATLRGLCFGDGYAVAQDRIAQMELFRRSARGEMAELVGRGSLEADRETRIEGYSEAEREAQLAALPDRLRIGLVSYADGVNAYLADAKAAGPITWQPANFPGRFDLAALRPWKATDSMAVGQMMARRFGGDQGGELRNLLILKLIQARYGKDAYRLFNDIVWRNDPAAPTSIPPAEDPRAGSVRSYWTDPSGKRLAGAPGQRLPAAFDPAAARAAARVLDQSERMRIAQRYGLMTKWGSYAIAIGGKRSVNGEAYLVGGPQMGFRTPSIAHEVHLSGAGIDVIGMGFAGVPGVLIGHSPYLAWTTTSGVNDQADVFVETLDPSDQTRYRYKGAWRPMEKRVETIQVARQDPVTVEVYRTVHGPVIQWDKSHNLAYSDCASYRGRELDTFAAIFAFYSAKTTAEFGRACGLVSTSHNWVCATRSGDIGYWFCGLTPVRAPGIDPRLPTPGDGSSDWRGFVPFEKMPHLVNPKQGFVDNWNTKPAQWWDNYDTPVWGAVWHSARIDQLLRAKPRIALEDLRNVLLDIGTHDQPAADLLPLLARAVKAQPATLTARGKAAARYVLAWDRHATQGSVAKTLFDAWLAQVRDALFGRIYTAMPSRDLYEQALQPSYVLHVLQGKASSVPPQFDYLRGADSARVMLLALNAAADKLAAARGGDMALWRYQMGQHRLAPVGPIPGIDRGTFIEMVECSPAGIHGWSILPPGQSERPDDRHFADQRDIAGWFEFKPMLTDRKQIEAAK